MKEEKTVNKTVEEQCLAELNVILERYNCYLDANILLSSKGISSQVLVIEKISEALEGIPEETK